MVGDLHWPRISTVPFLVLASFVFCRYDSELSGSGSARVTKSGILVWDFLDGSGNSTLNSVPELFESDTDSELSGSGSGASSAKVTKSGVLVWDFLDGTANSTLPSVPELSESDTESGMYSSSDETSSCKVLLNSLIN